MKTRTGLVSNSSSTSFIVSASEKSNAESLGLQLISVKALKDCYKQLEQLNIDFILDDMYQFHEINNLKDEDFISRPFDRDHAYELNIDYPAYMEDL